MIDITNKNVWFTADTHYAHTNICKGVTKWDISTPERLDGVRDFLSLDDMNNAIVENINAVVKEDDLLIHDGDWSFGGFDKIREFRERIICKNIIVFMGNHDHFLEKNKENIRDIFSGVYYSDILKYGDIKLAISHYKDARIKEDVDGYIHGHTHNKRQKRFGIIFEKPAFDVGLCGSPEFRPYHISELLTNMGL